MLKDMKDGQTGTKIFLDAMSKDKVHLARFVLDALDGEIVDSRTDDAQTPLISSVLLPEQTRWKFMELLLQRGASVNSQDGAGRTALSHACERGDLDAVKILVRNNADPEIADVWGNSALMYAAAAGHHLVVEYLVRAFKRLGLQVDRTNRAGNSAVEVATFLGHRECLCALTKKSSRSNKEQPPPHPEFHQKVEQITSRMEVLQTRDDASQSHYSRQTRLRVKTAQLPSSMDSIEEFEVRNPAPPPRPLNLYTNFTENQNSCADHLFPPLKCSLEDQKHALQSGVPSTLGTLLTPINARNRNVTEQTSDFRVRRFTDSYYKKRCSLPTSILSLAPPERTLIPARKFRTLKWREGSSGVTLQVTPPLPPTSSMSAFRNKMFRRFTSPEFKKDAENSKQDPIITTSLGIPRSESFPQDRRHPQVDSKPSIDSISSVNCEFDFHHRKADP